VRRQLNAALDMMNTAVEGAVLPPPAAAGGCTLGSCGCLHRMGNAVEGAVLPPLAAAGGCTLGSCGCVCLES